MSQPLAGGAADRRHGGPGHAATFDERGAARDKPGTAAAARKREETPRADAGAKDGRRTANGAREAAAPPSEFWQRLAAGLAG